MDRANRYYLVAPLEPSQVDVPSQALAGQEGLVIDSQPSEPPYLAQNGGSMVQEALSERSLETEGTGPEISVPLVEGSLSANGEGGTVSTMRGVPSLSNMALTTVADSTPNLNLPLVVAPPKSVSPGTMFWHLDVNAANPTQGIQTIRTYFELQEQLYPSFPRLVDAWDDGGAIVLLENRTHLACLKDVVTQPNVVPPQILHWCHEMTELWEVLSAHQCCQSLLTLDNVRIDEDHILCLRRLHFDDQPGQYTLKDLGQLWQLLFSPDPEHQDPEHQDSERWDRESPNICPKALVEIYQDLESAAIANLDTLRLRLEAAADQIHQSALVSGPLAAEGGEIGDRLDDMSGADRPMAVDSMAQTQIIDTAAMAQDAQSTHAGANEWEEGPHRDGASGLAGMNDDPTIVLPMQLHTLSNAGMTNIGIQRDHNEDFFSMDTHVHTFDLPSGRVCKAKGLYILCDGMGGHAAGEVASAAAGEALQTYFQEYWGDELPDEATIHEAIVTANHVIYEQNQADASEGARRMGTTLVMLLVQETKVAIAHVGDSRIYRFSRRQGLEQLTVDHEVGQREIARGVAPDVAYARPDAYQLTQALGPRDQDFIRPDIQFMEMNEDSLFILGSDGLTDNDLLETYCESYIEPLISTNANLEEGVYNLIELANQVNGHDNITVLVVRVKLRPKLSGLR